MTSTTTTTFASLSSALLVLNKSLCRRQARKARKALDLTVLCARPATMDLNIADLDKHSVKAEDIKIIKVKQVELDEDGLELIDTTKIWEEKFRQTLAPWDFGGDGEW